MDSDTVQWCNLPKDMLIMVAKRLGSRTEILRLRAVCSSWRSLILPRSLNKSPLFSVKFPFPIAPNPKKLRGGLFTLTEGTIYYLEPSSFQNPDPASADSSEGWMVKVAEECSERMSVLDTFSKIGRPRLHNLSPVNLLNFRVSEVSKVYDLETKHHDWDSVNVKKVVVSSNPAWIDDDSAVDHSILTIHTGGKLGYFKLGDKNWTMIDDGQGESSSDYLDILYHKERFYAIDTNGKTIVIDSSLNVSVIESPLHRDPDGPKYMFLVESNEDIYLVNMYYYEGDNLLKIRMYPYFLICLEVYKLNEEGKNWVRVRSLGDQTFFLGDNFSFSISAKKFSGCKGNCIYFRNKFYMEEREDHLGHNVCLFDLESRKCGLLSSLKGISQIFWPLPTWLNSDVSSEPSSSHC